MFIFTFNTNIFQYLLLSTSHHSSVMNVIQLFQDGRKLAYGGMQGIPMIATSPGEIQNSTINDSILKTFFIQKMARFLHKLEIC